MSFSVEIKGINRVANALRKLAALDKTILDPVLKRWAQGVRQKLKGTSYPAKRPGQTYVRTGNLANKWAVDQMSTGVWAIANRADYAEYVIGEEQAWFHEGRWWQAKDIIEGEIPQLTEDLSNEIERVWESG